MSATLNQEFIRQLENVGERLLEPPSSTPQLLNLLDELISHMSKIGQSPPPLIKEALLSTIKALISDKLMRHSDADVVVTVTACLHDIMRISAPTAPYDDEKMKEVFELIVLSFEKLSCPPGRCYTKAVMILESVARLRSCVMMLDLECDSLILKMFELFQKHISSNHPHTVFLAMGRIMAVLINESDTVSQELLKVLLESIRKENQDASPLSFKLGSKVVEECSEKLKPFIMEAVKSMGYCLDDYAPILSSILEKADHPVDSELTVNELQLAESGQPLNSIELRGQNSVTDSENASKKGEIPNSHNPREESLTGNGKFSGGSPHNPVKSNSPAQKSKKPGLTTEDEPSKRDTLGAGDPHQKKVNLANSLGSISDKKGKPKKDISGGSKKKSTSTSSKKDKTRTDDAVKSQKTESSSDDEVYETPHGRKHYKEDLIGCRIKVWWPLDRRYYEGTISSYDATNKEHKVDYDDGDKEVLNLRTEQWEFIGDEYSDIDLFVNKKTQNPCLTMPKKEASPVCEKKATQTKPNKREVKHDGETEAGEAKMLDNSSETKRPRLSDEHTS
ncbi:unnamed protein product [Amaranthus hypochondriacus]